MEVDLSHGLNSAKLHPGDRIEAKLMADWTDGACNLPHKSVLLGEVKSLSSPEAVPQAVAVLFHYACEGSAPQRLIWLALMAPEPVEVLDTHGNPVSTQAFRSSSFGEGDPLRPSGTKTGDMAGRSNPSLPLFTGTKADNGSLRPSTVKTGQVWHLPKLAMAVGTAPGGSTLITSSEKQVKVPAHAVLVLMPEKAALLPLETATAKPAQPAAVQPAAVRPAIVAPAAAAGAVEKASTSAPDLPK